MTRKTYGALLIFAALLATGQHCHASNNRVVYIECKRGADIRVGSGVIVSAEGHILTARHVAPPDFDCRAAVESRDEPLRQIRETPEARNIDKALDFTLWRFTPKSNEIFGYARYCPVNRNVAEVDLVVRAFSEQSGSGLPNATKGILSSYIPDRLGQVDSDALTSRGKSGGPVFLASSPNTMVGIVAGATFDPVIGVPTSYRILVADLPAKAFSIMELATDCPATSSPPSVTKSVRTRLVQEWSDWRKGGYNRDAWCNDVRTNLERELGRPIEWVVLKTDENSKEEFFRQFYYKYYCQGEARWTE